MDKIFVIKLQEAFTAATPKFIELGLPTVKHIDKFRGQTFNPEQYEAFGIPAVFYKMRCAWTKTGKLYSGDMTVDFHIVQDATWEISNVATNQDIGLKQMDFLAMVRSVLDNLSSQNTSKLQRLGENDVDTGVIIYDLLTYTCTYSDPKVIGSNMAEVIPDLKLQGNLVEDISPG